MKAAPGRPLRLPPSVALALGLASALAVPAGARKPAPPPCPAGRYLVWEDPLVAVGAALPDAVVVGADGTVAVDSGCPAVAARLQGTSRGTRVRAKWAKGACPALEGRPKLRATMEPTCRTMTGTLRAKRHERTFSAQLSLCGDGVDDPGEVCPLLDGPVGEPALDHVHDRVIAEGVPASEIEPAPDVGPVARTQLEIGFALDATVGEVNALLEAHGAAILATLEDVLLVVVRIPDPGSYPGLASVVDDLRGDAAVESVRLAGFSEPAELPANVPASGNLSRIDHDLAVRAAAAWNLRAALPDVVLGPSVLVADWFGNGAPGLDFDVFDADADYGAGGLNRHGYHVLGILAGSFGGAASDTGVVTGIYPTTLWVRAVDRTTPDGLTLADPTHEDLAIARLRTLLPGPTILNTSSGVACSAGGAPAACTAGSIAPHALAWIDKVRGSARRATVGAGLETSFLHVTAAGNVTPALADLDARLSGGFAAAAILPGLTDAAGAAVPNLTNAVVVENAVNEVAPPYAPLCLSARSKRPGDLAGIGTDVWSMTDASGTAGDLRGTSMAAPQVAGAAALLWALRPSATPQAVSAILRATAQPALAPIAAGLCDGTASSAPVLDAYAAALGADVPGSAGVRRTLLDQDGSGRFDEVDVEAFLDAFANAFGDFDVSRHDLNGDGYTGGDETASFDLDADDPPRLETVSEDLGASSRSFDETALRDLDVLCYYAWSDLYQGDADERDRLLATPCCADVEYALTRLDPGSADGSIAVAINDAGQIALEAYPDVYRWSPLPGDRTQGTRQPLALLSQNTHGSLSDINAAGAIVGSTSSSTLRTQTAVVWVDAAPQAVGPAGQYSSANAIDDAGSIAGTTIGVGGWLVAGGVTTPLAGAAQAMNGLGALAGSADFPNLFVYSRPALWPSATSAPVFLGDFGAQGYAADLSDAGVVVGTARTASPSLPRPFRSEGSGIVALPEATGLRPDGEAWGVNERGDVVGTLWTEDQNEVLGQRAVLWTDGVAVDLNTRIPAVDAATFVLAEAQDVNEAGQIVGWGVDLPFQPFDYTERAFLLTPRCGN